jgi:hypothetical protein
LHGLLLSKRMARRGPHRTGLPPPPPTHTDTPTFFRSSATAQQPHPGPAPHLSKGLSSLRGEAGPWSQSRPSGGDTGRLAEWGPGDSIQWARGFVVSGTGQRQPTEDGAGKAASLASSDGSEAHETAIERLYDQHYQALVDYGRGFISLHDAQDIVHTVFSRILKRNPHWVGSDYARRALPSAK